jgi:peroxiredoxin
LFDDDRLYRRKTMSGAVKLVVALIPACVLFGCAGREAPELEVGDLAPPFQLTAVGESAARVTSDDLRGKIAVLNFWSTNCTICLGEVKDLIQIHDSGKAVVVGIALEEDGDGLRQSLKELGIKYRVAVGDEALFTQFNGYAIPYTLVLDRSGKVRRRISGRIEAAELARVIEGIDRPSVASAPQGANSPLR